jgi:hypothetical protein
MTEDNSHAGQGSVLLDIGGDVGALVITMPQALAGSEIEARPAGTASPGHRQHAHSHTDDHDHDHGLDHGALVHVGVVGRPLGGETVFSAVFGALDEGGYDCYVRPDGPVRLHADIVGGAVTLADWPA